MSEGPRFRVRFRRQREGRTDYRSRLGLLRSGEPRAVVRLSGRRVRVALTSYDPTGDRVIAGAESAELRGVGFPDGSAASTPAAYLTGYLAGLRAKAAGTEHAILDTGRLRPSPGGRIFAALRGLLDAGIEIPHGETAFPSGERLNGRHLPKPLPESLDAYKGKLPSIAKRAEAAA